MAKFGYSGANTAAQQDHCNHGRDVGRRRRILSPANFVGIRAHEESSPWDEAEVVEVVSVQQRNLQKQLIQWLLPSAA